MKTLQNAGLMLVLMGLMAIPAQADIALFESGLNVDGTISDPGSPPAITPCALPGGCPGVLPGSVVDGRDAMGLGTFSLSIMGAGDHHVGFYADFEIYESTNTFYNEVGSIMGLPAVGQSWEIDEPGFLMAPDIPGDIASNFVDAILDGAIGKGGPEDVAMALAWDFMLEDDEKAVIDFVFSLDDPMAGLRLVHSDDGLGGAGPSVGPPVDIYFSSTLMIMDIGPGGPPGPQPVPEPSSMLLLAGGLIGGLAYARRKSA